jgi:CRISPR-associated protein Csb2
VIAIAVELLTGVYRAASRQSRDAPEWPPHPDRLFMALVAGHHESPSDKAEAAEERAALQWLEMSAPPSIAASARHDRVAANCFVPTNDDEVSAKLAKIPALKQDGVEKQLRVLPGHRGKKARRFPAVIPVSTRVHFVWAETPDDRVRRGLALLCAKLTRLGHSASLVRAWIAEAPPACVIEPCERGGDLRLRVPTSGRLALLEQHYSLAPSVLPAPGPSRGYRVIVRAPQPVRGNLAGHMIVLRRLGGTRVGLESTLSVCDVLRKAILQRCPQQPPPEWISGHSVDGSPSRNPHLAVIPLPMVDSAHADGHLLGLGVLVPGSVTPRERRMTLEAALTANERELGLRLWDGDWFEWSVEPLAGAGVPQALAPSTWSGPARGSLVWASVTPVVLDRHAKDERGVAATIAESCMRVGLPAPRAVGLSRACVFRGGLPANRFPALRRSDGSTRRHIHALIEFEAPVVGPVVIGAGRFAGYGLLRPVRSAAQEEDRSSSSASVMSGLHGEWGGASEARNDRHRAEPEIEPEGQEGEG